MKKMDQRGQISIEFVLILALMAIIVGAIAVYAGDANEQNVISSAARQGADNATTTLSLLNRSMNPVRVEDIKTINNGTNITLQIDITGSLSSIQSTTIANSVLNSIAAQGYSLTNNSIVTSRHKYTVKIV
ncbi:TadE/TadG family type IV pilus assembly protein [Methanobacterium sp.]|uniref:TadE/TadG family type IV pilus assembly protein n=1 Tax=Methanobacterium sp. TaxID=2164 RepID=UPI003C735AB3